MKVSISLVLDMLRQVQFILFEGTVPSRGVCHHKCTNFQTEVLTSVIDA